MPNTPHVSLREISKSYLGVQALSPIDIDFHEGEVHSLVGANGAGKSTLIKIITGAITSDSGTIQINDKKYRRYSPHEALFDLGIAAIYQEFNLVSSLTVADNIFFGKEIKNKVFLNSSEMNKRTKDLFSSMDFPLDPKRLVSDLSVAEQQMVEIGKALSFNVKVLIMDEPTAPLTPSEVNSLFNQIEKLKKKGITIIYISHRLEESLRISDRISVLRDGKLLSTLSAKETDKNELIKLMVGKELNEIYPSQKKVIGDAVLDARGITTEYVKNINFKLHSGEILGIAGLVGSGRTEVAQALIGINKILSGEVFIENKKTRISNPSAAMKNGIGLVPEDRKKSGILGKMSVRHNISYGIVSKISKWIFIKNNKEKSIVSNFISKMSIKAANENQLLQYLSGGNQQKVVLARLLASDCKILIIDEPTRGIDVGAKREIYNLINELSGSGKAIIMISSDLEEVISMSDRILVMKYGEPNGIISKDEANQEVILNMATD